MSEDASPSTVTIEAVVERQGQNSLVRIGATDARRIRSDWRRPMPVLVRVNDTPQAPWRTNMTPDGGGAYLLYLHGAMRDAASVDVGDAVHLEITFDESYRNGPLHDVPPWFADALEVDETARANWGRLSPSRQKEVLRYFAGLKSDEATTRNLERVMRVLGGANERFMGRDWRGGT